MGEKEPTSFPDGLPTPEDDGGADHLPGRSVPSIPLAATNDDTVDLSTLSGSVIVYCFPKMGSSASEADLDGWMEIPGAYGCTAEACGFRDQFQKLMELGVSAVFGLSLQTSDYQRRAWDRVKPPFAFLSDADLEFTDQLALPTFEVEGEIFNKRLTLVLSDGAVEHVFYPVFPPDEHAEEVVRWLEINQ